MSSEPIQYRLVMQKNPHLKVFLTHDFSQCVRMLEYLEDIVGSSRFKEPIGILKTRVEELDEHRTEKLTRVKLVEKEKDELEKPKDEALNYLHELNNIAKKNDLLYQLRVRLLCAALY